MSLVVAPEVPEDAAWIRAVVADAFHEQPAVADLVELIRASPQYVPELALVARDGDDVVGFVMVSHAQLAETGGRRHDVLTLSPLAVAPHRQRQGVGSALIRAALAAADAYGGGLVTLEGDPYYYRRFGFSPASAIGVTIHLPDWAPPTAAQAYKLRDYDPVARGTLQYPPAFDSVGEPD